MKLFAICLLILGSSQVMAWQDHPDKEDHEETDRIFKRCQELTRAREVEELRGRAAEEIKEYCIANNLNFEELEDVFQVK